MKKMLLILLVLVTLTGCSSQKLRSRNTYLEHKIKEYEEIRGDNEEAIDKYQNMLYEANIEIEDLLSKIENERNKIQLLLDDLKAFKEKTRIEDNENQRYRMHFLPTISPEESKDIIYEKSEMAIKILSESDFKGLSELTHPLYGIRFSPDSYINIERDLIFTKEEISGFDNNDILYLWRVYDSISGIRSTVKDYFSEFVYNDDFMNADEIGYNEVLSDDGGQFAYYHDSIIVEYYMADSNPDLYGVDWLSLRVVFQKYKGEWYITGLINNRPGM